MSNLINDIAEQVKGDNLVGDIPEWLMSMYENRYTDIINLSGTELTEAFDTELDYRRRLIFNASTLIELVDREFDGYSVDFDAEEIVQNFIEHSYLYNKWGE